MALVGYEWLVVAAVVIVLFMYGPRKLHEYARAIGNARREIREPSEREQKEQ